MTDFEKKMHHDGRLYGWAMLIAICAFPFFASVRSGIWPDFKIIWPGVLTMWILMASYVLSEMIAFPPILDDKNLKYASRIKSTLSVGVHIRRGDYLNLGIGIDPVFYHSALSEILASYPESTLFVFSDDPEWCEDHADVLGLSLAKEVVSVRGNTNGANYIDMQLLSMCKGLLISNSAFSYLAALLNNNLEFYYNLASWREL